jgi:hypothetical protein
MTVSHSPSSDQRTAPWLLDVGDGGDRVPLNVVLAERLTDVRTVLRDHGAVVLTGLLPLTDLTGGTLRDAMYAITGSSPTPYAEQSSPRTEVGEGVFTATDYPAHAEIFLHNELSYATSWPEHLLFYCGRPAEQGGQTVLADCAEVYRAIPAGIRAEFEAKDWMYVRNLRGSAGLDWQQVFQTTSRADVASYCRANDIELEWRDQGARLRAVRPVTLVSDGVPRWFNHVAAFHTSTLPAGLARSLRSIYAEQDIPVNTYFGTGEPIPDDTVREIRAAYERAAVEVTWRHGDLAVVANRLVAHGRRPFRGTREVFVVLAGEGHR